MIRNSGIPEALRMILQFRNHTSISSFCGLFNTMAGMPAAQLLQRQGIFQGLRVWFAVEDKGL
jgi:hypothetical protein